MESKYISIAEYAKRHGISKSHAYKLINSPTNQQFTMESNGRKLVREDMPLEIRSKPQKSKDSAEDTSIQLEIPDFASIPEEADKKPEETHGKAISANIPEATQETNELIEYYKKRIETLESIVADKDRQLQENTATITLLLERQQELTEKALQVATQAQYLQALPQKKQGFFRRLLGGGKQT